MVGFLSLRLCGGAFVVVFLWLCFCGGVFVVVFLCWCFCAASKMIVSCEASSKFHRTMLPKRAFRAMLPTIFTKNLRFATVSRNRHTDSYERVHPPKAKCASHYNAVHSQM